MSFTENNKNAIINNLIECPTDHAETFATFKDTLEDLCLELMLDETTGNWNRLFDHVRNAPQYFKTYNTITSSLQSLFANFLNHNDTESVNSTNSDKKIYSSDNPPRAVFYQSELAAREQEKRNLGWAMKRWLQQG